MSAQTAPAHTLGEHCENPGPCEYKEKCWEVVPAYSIFNVASKAVAGQIFARTGSYDVKTIPSDAKIAPNKRIELAAFLADKVYCKPQELQDFLAQIEYPIYHLDYETVASAMPLFDRTKPHQKIPFQFSRHIEHADGTLEHTEFLHQQRSDPRPDFIKALLAACGESGSVMVYNKAFEQGCNRELARDFPEYADALLAINNRMIDLYQPFEKRWLYHPQQKGSASIKYVLPSFVPELSYKTLNIRDGEQALNLYLAFQKGKVSGPDAETKLFTDLKVYCHLDTYAMVRILQAVRSYAVPKPQQPAPAP